MSQTDDRVHPKLPVTAEVGSEGGSYSDPTHQVASFANDVARTEQPAPAERIAGGPDPNHGMIRYPTEPPPPSSRRLSGPNWRAGAIGAAAGAVAVLGAEWLRRSRRSR